MSGIYVIFQPNGTPVKPQALQSMHQVFSRWYDDDHGVWCEGPVGLGHTMRWNTPESKLEKLPMIDGPTGERLAITADVRLDNRAELVEVLNIVAPIETVTDSQLLLAAYKKWGEDSPKHLLGDFAFVIWDEARQRLFCARDQIGVKSLYYCSDDANWVFANHVHAVVAVDGVSKRISEDAVCSYLKDGELYSSTHTFYSSVKKLPPATWMVISRSEFRTSEYWRIDDCPTLRFDSAAAYTERLTELLEDAVACRLRSDYPIACHLSGGLDSSSIAAIAARQLAGLGVKLHTYNWCPDPVGAEGTAAEEWARGCELAEHEGMKHRFVDFTAEKYASLLMEHDLTGNDTADLWYEFGVRRAASEGGQRTILSGWGGDQCISNPGTYVLAELLGNGRPFTVLRQAYLAARNSASPWRRFASLLYRRIVLVVLPDFFVLGPEGRQSEHVDFAGCATPHIALGVRAREPTWDGRRVKSVREDQLQQFHFGHLQNRLDSWAASAHQEGIEYRYPLLDRRVIEFALGIPSECYWQGGVGRYIFRKAVSHVLPDSLSSAYPKAEPERVRRLQQVACDAFSMLLANDYLVAERLEGRGSYVDSQAILATITQCCAPDTDLLNANSIDRVETVAKSILLLNL